ncbi:hypothetical protein NQ314_007354 [Rhamnusium bicolor]|uniref:Uncharacterized protein n=1 Tax=Rhamnusium bicolor TaxID=1586634 RepID=A0AAV8YPA4_9CUCU|nr:hypothetical protein NQ314_007354 [Rhamnusium bicolor]
MVSEESCTLSNKICKEPNNKCDKNWLSNGISNMSVKSQNDNNETESDGSDCNNHEADADDATRLFIEGLISEICDSALSVIENSTIITRDRRLSKQDINLRRANRSTSIIVNELEPIECINNFVNTNLGQRAVSECIINNCIIDENDNNDYFKESINPTCITRDVPEKKVKEKDRKKKLSFSFFKKKEKSKTKDHKFEEDSETDNLPQLPVFRSNTLGKSKKYASALELHQAAPAALHRTPSFIKKLVHISEDSSNFLKRSLSFRDLSKKKEKEPSRERLQEKKNQEWKQSLQSLVETDISVSYNDLSFVNYDALNDINYRPRSATLRPGSADTKGGYIGRTQSMIEKVSLFLGNFSNVFSVKNKFYYKIDMYI